MMTHRKMSPEKNCSTVRYRESSSLGHAFRLVQNETNRLTFSGRASNWKTVVCMLNTLSKTAFHARHSLNSRRHSYHQAAVAVAAAGRTRLLARFPQKKNDESNKHTGMPSCVGTQQQEHHHTNARAHITKRKPHNKRHSDAPRL